jgi:hypothetical protein
MLRIGIAALVAAVLATAAPVKADTAVFYSKPEDTFGWSAGWAPSRAAAEAQRYCQNGGGTACEQVLACRGGWGAVAYAEAPVIGVGAVCGLANSQAASNWAFTSCIVATGGVCKLDTLFYDSGRSVQTYDNAASERLRFLQWSLSTRFDVGTIDGQMGASTKAAIEAAQTHFGLPVTGQMDDELLARAIKSIGGIRAVADEFRRGLENRRKAQPLPPGYEYAWGPNPPKPLWTGERLAATYDTGDQMHVLARALTHLGVACKEPAQYGAPQPQLGSNIWRVDCAEGTYYVSLPVDGEDKLMQCNGQPPNACAQVTRAP